VAGEAGVCLQAGEQRVGGVAAEPPGGAGADELLAEAPAVGEADLAEESAVAVALGYLDGDQLAERERRRVLLRSLAVGLAALRGVDAAQPDHLGAAGPEDGERVAVGCR
jgi:hypothetical protein